MIRCFAVGMICGASLLFAAGCIATLIDGWMEDDDEGYDCGSDV